MNCISERFDKTVVVCLKFSFKSNERMSIGQSQIYLLVNPGMKIHHSISKFLSLGANKKRLVELILKSIIDKRENLGSPVVYFPVVYGMLSIR